MKAFLQNQLKTIMRINIILKIHIICQILSYNFANFLTLPTLDHHVEKNIFPNSLVYGDYRWINTVHYGRDWRYLFL